MFNRNFVKRRDHSLIRRPYFSSSLSSSSTPVAFRVVFLSRLLRSSSSSLLYTNKSTAKEANRPQGKFEEMTGTFQFTALCPASCYLETTGTFQFTALCPASCYLEMTGTFQFTALCPASCYLEMTGTFQFTALCPASCYLEILRLKCRQI